jgi:hypothetical protein
MGLKKAISRIYWSPFRGDWYGLLLLAVLDVPFVLIWIGGWRLGDYLYYNDLISKNIQGIFFLGSLILAFPVSFYLLKKTSDYFDLHGL